MSRYFVSIGIDIEADSPEAAAIAGREEINWLINDGSDLGDMDDLLWVDVEPAAGRWQRLKSAWRGTWAKPGVWLDRVGAAITVP